MPKVIVSMDGVVIKEVELSKDRTTLGRRPYNDVVIDNLAVSGEHAAFLRVGPDVFLEDLNSTNGSFINGLPVKKQVLRNGDNIDIGKHKIRFVQEPAGDSFDRTTIVRPAAPLSAPAPLSANAAIKVLSGAAAGREVPLTKVVTTLGKPGIAVAAITRRPHGYVLHHVEGASAPTLNGAQVDADPRPLKDGDLIQLAGTQMQFVQR